MTPLLDALRKPSPCDKFGCWFRALCKTELLACEAFAKYTETGRVARPTTAPRPQIYMQLFPGDFK